ncbi:MAG: potassium transporter [Candidatus Sericytochromatia bacterium]|nr:MAG: potassium transporter [Candidatus Sericytochromatia bacterium]
MNKINPSQTILFSYLILIIIGTFALLLPICNNTKISFIDALFTATSALTVTGLIVKDTPNDFTFIGQLVIMFLIQIGGLGYMTLITFFIIVFRGETSIRDQLILSEALNYKGLSGIIRFLRQVIIIVFFCEFLGLLFLFIYFFYENNDVNKSLYYSLFHSISAFNNAGFSLFSDNLMRYKSSLYINIVISILIFVGGIGYYVIMDIFLFMKTNYFSKNNSKSYNRISVHSKAVLLTSLLLILIGTLGILFFEIGNYNGIWKFSLYEKILVSLFSSISSRTAGFNTIDFSTLSDSTIYLIILLMFIGASPGGTGGGIKTITFLIIFMSVINYIKGSEKVVFMKREINNKTILKSMLILSLAFVFNFIITLLIAKVENQDFLNILFEVISASSTVGLSIGSSNGLSLVYEFSSVGKILIIISMIIGKIGILSFAIAVSSKNYTSRVEYPDSRLIL